jgi:D-psicose/D-tagatose/L-ribulose 3-epimerase
VIRYGAHTYLWTEYLTDAGMDLLDRMAEMGLDIAEIPTGDDMRFTPAEARRAARRGALTLTTSPGGFWPDAADISSDDPDQVAQGLAWHKRQLDIAAEMGAVAYTGAIYGHPGNVRRRVIDAAEIRRTAEGLGELGSYAAELNIKIALEPMSHFRTHLVNTPEQLMALIGAAGPGGDNLYALLDTYHMVTEVTDYADAFAVAAPRLWGVHACENDRGVPGRGIIPWDDVLAGIRDCGHDVNVIFESYNSATDFAWRRGMFHDVCPDGDTFVRRALGFCRSRL